MDAGKSQALAKQLGDVFKRNLIAIPLVHKYPHVGIVQRAGLQAATLEFDTVAFPNIEYIAGTRMSVYPPNPADEVDKIIAKLVDDLAGNQTPVVAAKRAKLQQQQQQLQQLQQQQPTQSQPKLPEPVVKFARAYGKDGLRKCLTYLYDICGAPPQDALRVVAEHAKSRVQRELLLEASRNQDAWDKWAGVGAAQSVGATGTPTTPGGGVDVHARSLRLLLDEYTAEHTLVSARALLAALQMQAPRQYSVSCVKSTKRFRTEIIVVQHRFGAVQIAAKIQAARDFAFAAGAGLSGPNSPVPSGGVESPRQDSRRQSHRSLRSLGVLGVSPISTHQVKRVPSFSGPLITKYASSAGFSTKTKRQQLNEKQRRQAPTLQLAAASASQAQNPKSTSGGKARDGLCSSHLLSLVAGKDFVVCEFVENPRFTLKGNRERPILMIGQDIGIVAFRAFWQQRQLEHDRAQVFYTLFKDLAPKKFGEMHLVALSGSKARIEDLFKREINAMLTSKVLSSVTNINRSSLLQLLHDATASTLQTPQTPNQPNSDADNNNQQQPKPIKIASKELLELGARMAKLLTESNGCLYTCCDAQFTQAIEILLIESLTSHLQVGRDKIAAMLPKWKGRPSVTSPAETAANNNKFVFTLENSFERAQIVHEVYDSSL